MKAPELRVGFCENGAGYGGAIISLAAFLEKIPPGFRPYLYTGLGSPPYRELNRVATWHHTPPVAVIKQRWLVRRLLPFASTVDNVFNLLPSAVAYYRAFRRDRIDLVYLNNDASSNMAAALGAKLARLPMVLHARGFNANTKGSRWLLANLAHCIPVSHAVKDELFSLGLPPEKCTVVPEGLDLNMFHPRPPCAVLRAELALSGAEPVITLVGGLIDWKGQDVLLDAVPAILDQFPDARILLVGSAYGRDNRFAEMITQKSRSPALRGKVHMLGSRPDIPAILSISSIVLHASTKPEPFGRTFLEGMAVGKPTIASNEGGPLDVIEHGVDGLLIEPRDPAILAAAVKRLLADPALCETLGRNAARKARGYSIENHANAIRTVLRNTMEPASR
jgi:glycosyltransferase involved in cell wall biosynthesis